MYITRRARPGHRYVVEHCPWLAARPYRVVAQMQHPGYVSSSDNVVATYASEERATVAAACLTYRAKTIEARKP